MMIPLTRGKFATVDADDAPRLGGCRWSAYKADDRWYAKGTEADESGESREVLMHRLLCCEPDGMYIDHKDHDGLNNRRENLRVCTNTDNGRNRARPPRDNTSGYVGVWFNKLRKKWIANIFIGGRTIHCGSFDTAEEAARARDDAARKEYGEFVLLNFPSSSVN